MHTNTNTCIPHTSIHRACPYVNVLRTVVYQVVHVECSRFESLLAVCFKQNTKSWCSLHLILPFFLSFVVVAVVVVVVVVFFVFRCVYRINVNKKNSLSHSKSISLFLQLSIYHNHNSQLCVAVCVLFFVVVVRVREFSFLFGFCQIIVFECFVLLCLFVISFKSLSKCTLQRDVNL